VSSAAFESYYLGEAETWEHMAMTRARVVWATSPGFAAQADQAIERALRRPRSRASTIKDVREMRALMERERPPKDAWDLKLSPGGLVDIEFAVQFLQLANAADGGPLLPNTAEALAALRRTKLAPDEALEALQRAWRLQQDVTQLMKLALEDGHTPDEEPAAFRKLMARAGHARGYADLRSRLAAAQAAARAAYEAIVQNR
jgi:glutamate-ammonia-ligase adenylyltransferase